MLLHITKLNIQHKSNSISDCEIHSMTLQNNNEFGEGWVVWDKKEL